MNVSLTPQLEKMIRKEIKSGRYSSASEVVRDALRLFHDRQKERARKLEALKREINIGLEQSRRGLGRPFDDNMIEEIKVRGRRRLAAMRARPQ